LEKRDGGKKRAEGIVRIKGWWAEGGKGGEKGWGGKKKAEERMVGNGGEKGMVERREE
jgi:hypothetical protein